MLCRGALARLGRTRTSTPHGPPGGSRAARTLTRGDERIPPSCFRRGHVAALLLLWALGVPGVAAAQSAPGTTISNTATVAYLGNGGQPRRVDSNSVDITTVAARTSASTTFARVVTAGANAVPIGSTSCLIGATPVPLPRPVGPDGAMIAAGVTVPVAPTNQFASAETAFVRVVDPDQNLDPAAIDSVLVTVTAGIDTERLLLAETAPASGEFVGYVPLTTAAAASEDCFLSVAPEATLDIRYVDAFDADDQASASAIINPLNRVFDAATGDAVNGVTLTVVDAATGLPATVFGNDGVSAFPATVRSGESVADASGLVYAVPAGGFVFPVLAPGDYRLVIETPAGFLAPSIVAPAALAALPNGPFAISDASFARPFSLVQDDVLRADVPVDPVSGALFLTKTTTTQVAAPGDFVAYRLTLDNTSQDSAALGVTLTDVLPPGFDLVTDSVRVDGQNAAAVETAGGFSLPLGMVPAGGRREISYIVEVTAGARGDEAINLATATSDRGLASNKATAAITLRDDLLRDRATLIGRVIESDCERTDFAEDEGVAGIRLYMEDGRYAVTDASGRFHFEGVRPGLHNVQLDDITLPDYLELATCAADARRAGSARSQFVNARGGALLRADFYVRRKAPQTGYIDIELENMPGARPEVIDYRVTLRGVGEFDVSNLTVTGVLPPAAVLVPDSAVLSSGGGVDAKRQGRAAVFRLGERSGVWQETLSFSARVPANADGKLETRALAMFDTAAEKGVRTPALVASMQRTRAISEAADYVLSLKFGVLSATLTAADRRELDALIAAWQGVESISISAQGHSDNVPIAARNRDRYADNYALSEARARTVAEYLANALAVPADRLTIRGLGSDRPVASNADAAGREKNRRVELVLTGKRPAQQAALKSAVAKSGRESVVTSGPLPGPRELAPRRIAGPASVEAILNAQKTPVPAADSLSPGVAWVLPSSDFRPAIPSIRVAVQHAPGQSVRLAVNDTDVPALSVEGVEVGRLSKVAITKWRGVRLADGANRLTATVVTADGTIVDVLARDVHYAGGPLRAELVPEASHLVADGRERPVIAVRLYDGAGQLARTGAVGRFQVDAPYRSWWEVETSQENNLVAAGEREPLYRVEPDGIARIELEPTTVAGEIVLRLAYENQREQEIRTWLAPAPRDWILVALAEGTAAYNTISDNLEAATDVGFDDDIVEDGRVAFFAKGRVRGDALLTLAYDSSGAAEDFSRFDDVIDPNAFYTLYGDGTESRFDAASQRKLYLKLERRQFALLFGDYATALGETELARYERRFNGLSLAYNGANIELMAFGADTAQRFARDEIRGNGTSGLYPLSATGIVPNSDVITLEVRDRFDASEVISTTALTRFVDYSIDYARGTLLFKRPIASRDDTFNPQFIVARYETVGGDGETTAGGRLAVKTADERVEVGATLVREAQANGDGELLGVDLAWQPTPTTRLTAEYADTTSNDTANERRGHGYRLAVEHRTGRLDVEAFHANVESEFGLGQQNVSEIGLRKTGINGRLRISENIHGDAEVVHQENLDTGLVRDLANVSVNAAIGGFSADFGVVAARDETVNGETRESTLARIALGQRVLDDRVTLRVSAEMPLDDQDSVTDYPTRMLTGVDIAVGRTATAYIEHEMADGDALASDMTRVGLRAQPWQRARFDTTLTQELSEFGPRLFATVGAVQGWQVSERWTFDIGVDQSNTMQSPDAIVFDDEREFVSGSQNEDFTAAFVGTAFTAGPWTLNGRAEHRNADTSEAVSVIGGLFRASSAGRGMSAALEWFDQETLGGGTATTANLRAGWAARSADHRWAFLNRADLIVEERTEATLAIDNWRLINNLATSWRPAPGAEFNFTIGAKYVRGDIDNQSVDGVTTLTGAEWRRTLSPRWDIGVHGDVYRSWRAEVTDFSAGVDVGYTVAENMRVIVGYNALGFRDDDFKGGNYTVAGPYVSFAMKADQETLRRIAGLGRR